MNTRRYAGMISIYMELSGVDYAFTRSRRVDEGVQNVLRLGHVKDTRVCSM